MCERRALTGPQALFAVRTDTPRGHRASSTLLARALPMACLQIRNRFRQALTGKRHTQWKAHRPYRAKCKSGPLAYLASHVSRARRVNPAFSVLRVSTATRRLKASRW